MKNSVHRALINQYKRQPKVIGVRILYDLIPTTSKTVKVNVDRIFFKLINDHFAALSKMSKLFNKNNMRVNYFCNRNIKMLINDH